MRLVIVTLMTSLLAGGALADDWFGELYGDTNGVPFAYAGPDLSDRPAISSTDHLQGQVPSVVRPPQIGNVAGLTDGSGEDADDVVAADFGADQPMILTWEDSAGTFVPSPIYTIRSFGGNADTRNWQNVVFEWKDSTGNWTRFFQDHNFGHLHAMINEPSMPNEPWWGNNIAAEFPSASKSLVEISNGGLPLLSGETVYGLRATYWLVSKFDSSIRPSFEEMQNGFDPVGDGVIADVTGSILEEIDVIVPEPASAALLLCLLPLCRRR
jgi:hypothetical protein